MKNPDMLEKIVRAKVTKNLGDRCLLSQAHMIEEGSPMVEKYLLQLAKENVLTQVSVGHFTRWVVGEKLEEEN